MTRRNKITIAGIAAVMVIAIGAILYFMVYLPSRPTTNAKILATPYTQSIQTMGTTVTITDYTNAKGQESAVAGALKIAQNYNTWATVNQKGSIVDEINNGAGNGKPVKVSAEMFTLIQDAYDLSSQGTGYDVTIGALTQLWHIGFPDAKLPTQTEIDAVLPTINYKFLILNKSNQTVYLSHKGTQLDLGSITKGYTAKLMTAYLKAHGMTDGIVDLGSSSLYIMGHSPRGAKIPWNVGVKDPNNPTGENIGILTAENQFVSTSGIYERYLKVGNTIYPHILNPATGFPFSNDIQSITIVGTDDATYGDGVSTTIFALGTKKGYAYVLAHHLQAVFVDKGGKVYVTPGLKGKFTLNSASNYKLADISSLQGNG
ncbi:MAG: FAD:protein FMN transferase [Streptococcaceae bacterium]|nr:FAD:protein FMN transferase [Streptococcaceae bacterium]